MQITAKFHGKCAETGERIARGDTIDFDPETKRTVLVKHNASAQRERLMRRYENTDYFIAKYGSKSPA